ncbi:hypothetical protein [Coleofasciculus sp. H7-2]|uniref:hypothetical protein n=1 Tax=Coleofasciculus sp. H7-2 TaxID=3351545 RepID=UPI00366F02D5
MSMAAEWSSQRGSKMAHRQRIQRVLRLCFLINRAQTAIALYELSNFNVYRLVP